MRISPDKILSSPFSLVYAVYGNEPLLTLEACDMVRQKAKSQGFLERKILTVETGFQWQRLMEAAENTSLFSPNVLIDLRVPNGKWGRDGAAVLKNYLQKTRQNVLLLIYLGQLDWKDEKTQWFAELSQKATLICATAPTFAQLPSWLAFRLKNQNQSAPIDALQFIAERVEGNLLAAHQEIQKLALLYPQRALTFKEIEDCVLNVARYSLNHLREALLLGNLARYAKVAQSLLEEGEVPILILWALTEEVRALLQIKQAQEARVPMNVAFKSALIWGERQAHIKTALSLYSKSGIENAFAELEKLDCVLKGAAKNYALFLEDILRIPLILKGLPAESIF